MGISVLDQELSLTELLDVEGFREVARSFSELYGIGIKVFDLEGNKVADVRASTGDYCGCLFTHHHTQVMCTQLVNQIRTSALTVGGPPQIVECFSGLRYAITPLVYEGTVVGRFIFGPYAPMGLESPPGQLSAHAPELDMGTLAGYLTQIPRAIDETIQKVLAHITTIFSLIIHTSYRTQLTSKLHISSIQGAFADLERTNRELKAANQKLKEFDRLKSNFIATVSHELRTPLTSVIGYSEMLIEGMAGELNPEQKEYVATILEKGDSLLQLIGEVLDLARIESGTIAMNRDNCQLAELVQLAVTDVAPQASKREITIRVDAASPMEPAWVDADKIRRVVNNLLSNGVKFSTPGSEIQVVLDECQLDPKDPRYDIFESERNRYQRLRVIDTGVGIPEESQEEIFEAFHQVDNSSTREFGGTGLGLSIARNFVRAHGGWLEVTSRPGQGSTFTVYLPCVEEAVDPGLRAELLSGSTAG